MNRPEPDDVVYYAAGPLDGQLATPGRSPRWSAYRELDGSATRPAEGDRDLARYLRGGPDPALYVLARSARTGWWVYCHAPFLPSLSWQTGCNRPDWTMVRDHEHRRLAGRREQQHR